MKSFEHRLKCLPCLDSAEMAARRKQELDISSQLAVRLGESAIEAVALGYYLNDSGAKVSLSSAVAAACDGKQTIPPDQVVSQSATVGFAVTSVQVTNETTLGAALRMKKAGLNPLALNFANGIVPGGGFLVGARAQEEALCRTSALYQTLLGDPMYDAHLGRDRPDSTDWVIYSPRVPIFRDDAGNGLDQPWLLSFLTCAAPYEPDVGQPEAGDLLERRIHRVLEVARSLGYSSMVLGAWGCGAFGNDPVRTARDFRKSLESDLGMRFSDIAFAITDWSDERRFLGPFRDVFADDVPV